MLCCWKDHGRNVVLSSCKTMFLQWKTWISSEKARWQKRTKKMVTKHKKWEAHTLINSTLTFFAMRTMNFKWKSKVMKRERGCPQGLGWLSHHNPGSLLSCTGSLPPPCFLIVLLVGMLSSNKFGMVHYKKINLSWEMRWWNNVLFNLSLWQSTRKFAF